MTGWLGKAVAAGIAGTVLALGVVYHEWQYHADHPGSPGVSVVLIVLAIAVALASAAAGIVAWEMFSERTEAHRKWMQQFQDPPAQSNSDDGA
jgi:flagellar basal body-associated protein FliL